MFKQLQYIKMEPIKFFIKVISLNTIFLFATTSLFSQTHFKLWGDLPKGSYSCGFKRIVALDKQRTHIHGNAVDPRPVIMNVWYPSAEKGASMEHGEYLNFDNASLSTEIQQLLKDYNQKMILHYSFNSVQKFDSAKVAQLYTQLMNTPTGAIKDAAFPTSKFPLIIYHQGLGASIEDNAAMNEMLASNGFVVVSAAYQSNKKKKMLNVSWDLELSIAEIDFMIHHLKSFDFIDFDRIGLMGHSYGAQAVLAYPFKGKFKAKGILSLDSTLDNQPSYDAKGYKKLLDIFWQNISQYTLPTYIIAGQSANFAIMDSFVYAPRYYQRVKNLRHADYIAQGALGAFLEWPFLKDENKEAYKLRWLNFQYIGLSVLNFWESMLKNNEEALAFLSNLPEENNAPDNQFQNHSSPVGENLWSSKYRFPTSEELKALTGNYDGYTLFAQNNRLFFKFNEQNNSEIYCKRDSDLLVLYLLAKEGYVDFDEDMKVEKIRFFDLGQDVETAEPMILKKTE